MKGFITILLVLLTTISVGQNTTLFDYINEYRVSNGKKEIKCSSELSKISFEQVKNVVSDDSLSHSGTQTFECVTKSPNIAPTPKKKAEFEAFLKKNFNMEYVEPTDSTFDINKFAQLYMVFLFSKSPKHNTIMLINDVTEGSSAVFISDKVKLISNKRVIGGKTYTFEKIVSHIEVNFVGVFNVR